MSDEIQVILDMTRHRGSYGELDDFVELWTHVESELHGQTLAAGTNRAVERPEGPVFVRVMSTPQPQAKVANTTRFAVHSVIQRPPLIHPCRLCAKKGRDAYGPYQCVVCRGSDAGYVCDQHMVMLEGKLDVYCNEHAPLSPTGDRATFWCFGRNCRGQQAWSARDRAADIHDTGKPYCVQCYQREFPACWVDGCDRIGTLTCEQVNRDGETSCPRRICSVHASRWQIYGPHDEGLSLCSEHGESYLDTLKVGEIIYQIAAASAKRRLQKKRLRSRLPTLPAVKHTILKRASNEETKLPQLYECFASLTQSASTRLQSQIARLVAQRAGDWEIQIRKAEQEEKEGLEIFGRVNAQYRKQDLSQVADALTFLDYRPEPNMLFVQLDKDFIGMALGKGGSKIDEVQRSVGVRINIKEKRLESDAHRQRPQA